MMINYASVYNEVDQFLQTREGLANPKQKQDYQWFVRELTGILCGAAYENNLTDYDISDFLLMSKVHELKPLQDDGKLHNVADLISDEILNHPLYFILEFTLMNYKPGNVQVGPGEFFFCFFDCSSVFGIDNQAGFDVMIDGTTTELKKLGSNFTDPKLFDEYQESAKVDRLMIVKPVSNAANPRIRSQYACVTFAKNKWWEAFTHTGKAGTLALIDKEIH